MALATNIKLQYLSTLFALRIGYADLSEIQQNRHPCLGLFFYTSGPDTTSHGGTPQSCLGSRGNLCQTTASIDIRRYIIPSHFQFRLRIYIIVLTSLSSPHSAAAKDVLLAHKASSHESS